MTNKILALKYRPQEFKDLIGQEVMAQTITNAIKLGKTPNAYLLTGIRGVGKTTTARLIALLIVWDMTSWPIKSLNSCGLYLSAKIVFVIFRGRQQPE